MDLNISSGNLNKELQENKGKFAILINNIQSVCEGKELRDLIIPDTLLSSNLHQSIQNLAEKYKKCVNLDISSGNLNTKLQENKEHFARLINNIQSVCEGKELRNLIIPDALLSRNLHQSIQNLAEKDKNCVNLNIRYGNLNNELQENKDNFARFINNIQSVCEGKELHDLKIPEEQQSKMSNILFQLAEKEKQCTGLKTINENLRKELAEKNTQWIGNMKCVSQGNNDECCPSDWRMFNHSCYYFSQLSDTWLAAKKWCEEKQSHLVMIKSSKQQDFLKSILKNKYWIGLTDADHEGQWKWVDGKPCDCTGDKRL
ncbi:low affinity immunoglobulin epsilon Fc receptor-like [Protopterus annectens]|uniref:low affinity immunoglobulin epsilon Fc receptor-like n=1 Tax=Protopterus annectens TaxID=7888 RepID=UPI001CFAB89B|nr:low affinity immunoglobulin epsilon Fc receptor-like [Protopterus annectens]